MYSYRIIDQNIVLIIKSFMPSYFISYFTIKPYRMVSRGRKNSEAPTLARSLLMDIATEKMNVFNSIQGLVVSVV